MTWVPSRKALVLIVLGTVAGAYSFAESHAPKAPAASNSLSEQQKIVHALDRLTFGARPGEVQRIREIGLKTWLQEQLHPMTITQSPVLAEKLAPLDTLDMPGAELAQLYPPPQVLRAIAEGKRPMPEDPVLRERYGILIARQQRRLARQQKGSGAAVARPVNWTRLVGSLNEDEMRVLRRGTLQQRTDLLESVPGNELNQVLRALPFRVRHTLIANASEDLQREILDQEHPAQVILHDLWAGKIYRDVYSDRQLQEVLVDFWFNHFNVPENKGAERYMVTPYVRDAIRPYVFGKFGDMLRATAESPAMLYYLDNWQSADPQALARVKAQDPATTRRLGNRGLNENYARELLELQTLGVDGGYTQQDVKEVARCFTGWTIRNPNSGGAFWFNPSLHDNGPKIVLGHKIAAGGMNDGLEVLDILASQPSTARFISTELAQRFVADNPPASLVNRMAKPFLATKGDLRAVMQTMINSPEFFAKDTWRAKFKSPLEYVVSSLRATGADVTSGYAVAQEVARLGEPLYLKQRPTGYPNTDSGWAQTDNLNRRMDFALVLAANRIPGAHINAAKWDREALTDPIAVARKLLNTAPSIATRENLLQAAANKGNLSAGQAAGNSPVTIAGLVLGSPDFQLR